MAARWPTASRTGRSTAGAPTGSSTHPIVVDLDRGERIDLTDVLSTGGQRISVTALMWSPDGDQIAVIVETGGYNDPDRDLVVITLSPLHATYVATMTEAVGHGVELELNPRAATVMVRRINGIVTWTLFTAIALLVLVVLIYRRRRGVGRHD